MEDNIPTKPRKNDNTLLQEDDDLDTAESVQVDSEINEGQLHLNDDEQDGLPNMDFEMVQLF